MTKKNTVILIIVFAAVMVIAVFAYNKLINKYGNISQNGASQTSKISAPDFTVYDENKKTVKLSEYAGKPVVVNFWASWCGYCVQEMPDFNKAYNEYSDVTFLMLNVTDGQKETLEKAQKFIADKGFDFKPLFDLDLDASQTYGTTSLPATVFIDKNGVISGAYLGAINYETIKTEIEKINK